MNKRIYGLSLLSGALLFFSFPKYGNPVIAWFALVPLLIALRNLRIGEGFRAGFISGLIGNIGILYWITFVIAVYGGLPVYFGMAAMLLLAAFLSLFIGGFAAAVVYLNKRGIPEVISAPLVWTVLEFIKSHIFTGFPWENLAYSQHSFLPLIQVGDITGFYGISFLIVLVNVIIHDVISGNRFKRNMAEVVLGAALISCAYGYGLYRIGDIKEIAKGAETGNVVLIQGNIDQNIKWKPEFQDETLRIYKDLTLTAAAGRFPTLIVWPETATPFYFQETDDRHREILNLAKTTKSHLLLGSPSYKTDRGRLESLNSAFLVNPEGVVTGQYDKIHLVPFGEYVPLRRIFPFMGKLVAGIGDFRRGDGFNPLTVDDKRVGVLICYEAIFPEISRAYIKAGIDLFVNITNDAWFGKTSAPYQHLSMTAFRAVESRRYIVRAANTGITAIISPTGEIESSTELFRTTSLNGQVRFINIKTIYSRIGDVFVYLCFGALGVIIIISIRRKDHVGRNKREDFRTGEPGRDASELSLKSREKKKK